MNHAVNGRVLREDLIERLVVGDVDLVEVGAATAEELNSVESNLGGVVEVVDDHDIVAMLEEGEGSEATDVASATAKGGEASALEFYSAHGGQEARALNRGVANKGRHS